MGRRGQRGCSPMGTLPRCGPSCHGKLVSYPHHVTLVFMPSLLFFPLHHNHFCPSHSDLAFACSLGIPLEVKSCLCSSWEQCLSTSRRKKGQKAPKSNHRKQLIMKMLYLEILSKIFQLSSPSLPYGKENQWFCLDSSPAVLFY